MSNNKLNQLEWGIVRDMDSEFIVDYLKSKGVKVSEHWTDVWEQAHAQAFTAAKASSAEILDTLRWGIEKALKEKQSYADFIKEMKPLLEDLGWWGKIKNEQGDTVQLGSPWRLKHMLRTNKITAYHAGRYARQMENIDEQPYFQYVAIRDNRTRASHLALHGKVYPANDPIWEYFYPPNEYGCRCRVESLSEFALKRQGLKVESSEGKMSEEEITIRTDELTGEVIKAKVTKIKTDQGEMRTGAGWNYNVGSASVGSDVAILRKLQQLKTPELRQQVIQQLNNSELRHKAFENWVRTHLGKRGASNRYISAGFVTTEIAEKVTALSEGMKMSEQVLVMTEKRLEHANSLKHHQENIGLTIEEYASISRIIANPKAVLWDKQRRHNNLIYINQEGNIQVVVDAPNQDRLKPSDKVDAVINAYRLDMKQIESGIKGGIYILIQGEL